jgi:hypothetical protein
MKRAWTIPVFVAAALPAAAQQEVPPSVQEELRKMRDEIEALKRQIGEEPGAQDPESLAARQAEDAKRKAGSVYSKPFLARFGRGVHLGGYIDLEYIGIEESNNDTFDQHRLVPFLYADISDALKFAAEIEIEHGNGTELGVEFAHVDWWMSDAFNIRAGIILDPLGKFNLVHDAPFQDLTLRPLVDEGVIPVVLREPGIGAFGSFDADPWKIDYELYLVNGFKGLSRTGATVINTTNGLRNARPHTNALGTPAYRDFNDNKAVVGRVAASPFLGLEVGGSFHHGKYDERGDNDLTILALDWTISGGGLHNNLFGGGPGFLRDFLFPLEIVGEIASADLETDARAEAASVPDSLDGWFVEVRYHFMVDAWRTKIPGGSDESTFTGIVRFDRTDFDGAERAKTTFGLNFRLREASVIKFEYGLIEESGDAADIDNDVYAFSIASYF